MMIIYTFYWKFVGLYFALLLFFAEYIKLYHGGSDSPVIKRRQQQLGRMADFLPSVTFSVFDL